MPTKTDRILSYLPHTFRALPPPTALYSVVDALGNELLHAENSLAAVMLAHWVDHADKGADLIEDLACIAALYGLSPRGNPEPASGQMTCPSWISDETVEEFRQRLKRHVRTFIEGTTTVQGVLRVTAEALGLEIADAYADMDTWWTRPGDVLVTVDPAGEDAAELLFGTQPAAVSGRPPRPARVVGTTDLSAPVDLSLSPHLRLSFDGSAPAEVDLRNHVPNPAAATLEQIVAAINGVIGRTVAGQEATHLTLASSTDGPDSRLEIADIPGDAAPSLLGLLPYTYRGADATAAQVVGQRDLAGGVDLRDVRYLRLVFDGTHRAEVDCAATAAHPEHTTLDEIVAAINAAFGAAVAAHDSHRLTLTSTTQGAASSISIEPAAAQDASMLLLGPVGPAHTGSAALPARVVGARDLGSGIDLRGRSQVRIRIDAHPPVTVSCAGANPAVTLPSEITAALNAALGLGAAWHDGRFIHLESPTAGAASLIAFEPLPAGEDAAEAIFGIGPRVFTGAAATRAQITGTPDLSGGVDVRARHVIRVSLDHRSPVDVDLRHGAAHPERVGLGELVTALDRALSPGVASEDGHHLRLSSPTLGDGGSVVITPLETERRRRFVTRAFVTGEAATLLFGFHRKQASGIVALPALVTGETDLSRGVNLEQARLLRIGVDGSPPREVDCAAGVFRPRATLIADVVKAINAGLESNVASDDGLHLMLASPTPGASSRIVLESPHGALDAVLGLDLLSVTGRDATAIRFVGTVDLSSGVDLSGAATVSIGLDGAAPVEINCAGIVPAHTTLNEIAGAINQHLNAAVASADVDGRHIILTAPRTGRSGSIEFARPAAGDATRAIFGISAPRTYHGEDATAAQVIGTQDRSQSVDLGGNSIMRLAIDGRQLDVDCAGRAKDPVHLTLPEIVAALDAAFGAGTAAADGPHLRMTSHRAGSAARIDLLPYTAGDARGVLLGLPDLASAMGSDSGPAVVKGTVDLRVPVNLAERSIIRVAVDGGPPTDVDVAGAAPDRTVAAEVVAKLNAVFPRLADLTPDDHLRLTSPTAGGTSALEVFALRALELVEYPPTPVTEPPQTVRHGGHWIEQNDGAGEADVEIAIRTTDGVAGPEIVNLTGGWRVRLMVGLGAGETAKLRRDRNRGLCAEIIASGGETRSVPATHILVGPLGAQAWVPFTRQWHLSGGDDPKPATLQLNDPDAPAIVLLRARLPSPEGNRIAVNVTPAAGPDAGVSRDRFDVTLSQTTTHGDTREERYAGVRIGHGVARADSLVRQITIRPSQLVHAVELDKGLALVLPRGRSLWAYLECYGARFDRDDFEAARFAGGVCAERGVFDASRFADDPADLDAAVFAPSGPSADAPAEISFYWKRFQPGAFVVNLPADLPDEFGGRFGEARFGRSTEAPERYEGVVSEPEQDPDWIVNRVKGHSALVTAAPADRVPIGWSPQTMPFRHPRSRPLTGGRDGQAAQIYLAEPGAARFIHLSAKQEGAWGNAIEVTVRPAGPARFDLIIDFHGARFERARCIARGRPLPVLVDQMLQPGPVGVLQAKAGGIQADVTRDRTGPTE